MAIYRSIYTRIWREDDWFSELPPTAKMFWFYLITNPSTNQAGIYRLTARTMANETGLALGEISDLVAQFQREGKVDWCAAPGVVWVHRMREYQTGEVNGKRLSPSQLTGIENDLREVPDCTAKRAYLRHYGYPVPEDSDTLSDSMDTPAIGYEQGMPTVSIPSGETETEREMEQHNAPTAAAPVSSPDPLTACLDYLRAGEGVNGQPFNPAAAVARLFTLRFGETYPSNYGRLGRLAGQLSGGYIALAQMIWAAPRVEGDPHDYLTRTAGGAPNRRRGARVPSAQGEPEHPATPDPQLAAFRRQRAATHESNQTNGANGASRN